MGSKKEKGKNKHQPAQIQTNGEDLKNALDWVLTDDIFTDLRLHGNIKWNSLALVRLAIFWVWSSETGLVESAKWAIQKVGKLFGNAGVRSYQVLMNALNRYTPQLLPRLWARLQHLMLACGKDGGRVGLWLPIAGDGSRVTVPRTRKNEEQFCKPAKKRGQKKSKRKKRSRHAKRQAQQKRARTKSHYDPQPVGPQIWLTLLWHIELRLPWCWKLGPSYASERDHLKTMLEEQTFPDRTLFCCDAGFVGYEFWRAILAKGHQFLIRVGGNVRLLKKLRCSRKSKDIVYCWPDKAMKENQLPLVLRLLRFHDGRGDVYLVTSVMEERELTKEQAGSIYRSRWGIEVQFRSFKQTYARAKLRSRTPENAEMEMHWSLLGLTMLQLFALKEQSRINEPPPKTSIAGVLRVVRSMLAEQSEEQAPGESMQERLREATIDTYERQSIKKSRNYPRRKEEPSAGKPIVVMATARHKAKLQEITSYDLAA